MRKLNSKLIGNMLWKLLRQHISVAQLAGFFIANLCGMVIVMLGIQFYSDVSPVFEEEDSFIKKRLCSCHKESKYYRKSVREKLCFFFA